MMDILEAAVDPEMIEVEDIDMQSDDPVTKLERILAVNNVAEIMTEDELKALGRKVIENYQKDKGTMENWLATVEKGIELMMPEWNGRSKPWQDAANFKSPMVCDAVLTFGDKASQELLRKNDVVKGDVVGPDPDNTKGMRMKRVATMVNYQLNYQMRDWRDNHDRLCYVLPSTGCMFKKTYQDTELKRPVSEMVMYPDFVVNNDLVDGNEIPCFSQIEQFYSNERISFERTGKWIEADYSLDDELLEAYKEDNPDFFIEQISTFDLDGDGYEEPYVVTMHYGSNSVVRIVKLFDFKDILVSLTTGDLVSMVEAMQIIQNTEFAVDIEYVAFIENNSVLTKYDFLPSLDGHFLGWGYPHLLAGPSFAVNSTTNQLLDAGTLANLPGGYLAKGVRKNLGSDKFRPGEWKSTNVNPRDLQSAFFPLPFKEPSSVLFQLNEKMQALGERTAGNADISSMLSNNAPATTTLAILQEKGISTSSIIKRIYRAMCKEFEKIMRLNKTYLDPELYATITNDPNADVQADFDTEIMLIRPVANPEQSSKIERVKAGEVLMNFLPQIAEAGGNTQVVISDFLDAIGNEKIEQIFPQPQPDQIDRNTQAVEEQNQQLAFQNQLFDRELSVKEQEAQIKTARTITEIGEIQARIVKIHADAVLALEKAETEDEKNNLDRYKKELDVLLGAISNQQKTIEGNNETTRAALPGGATGQAQQTY